MTFPPDLSTHLDTLDKQQANLTTALQAMLEGNWTGAPPSAEITGGVAPPGGPAGAVDVHFTCQVTTPVRVYTPSVGPAAPSALE